MAQSLELRLVGEEVLTNIVKYAETGAPVEVEIQASTDEIVLEFRDRGRAFDPLAAEEPDLEASVEERALGGLGIYLVRELMDDVAYRREEGTNILRVVKRL